MPDIRDVLKGLSPDDRALYQETRTNMRRAYLAAHAKILPIEQYDENDDHFLDVIDLRIAILFDRAGVFNHVEGHIDTAKAVEIEAKVEDKFESAATRMMKADPHSNGAANNAWPKSNA